MAQPTRGAEMGGEGKPKPILKGTEAHLGPCPVRLRTGEPAEAQHIEKETTTTLGAESARELKARQTKGASD